jgi:hypothetical protein
MQTTLSPAFSARRALHTLSEADPRMLPLIRAVASALIAMSCLWLSSYYPALRNLPL